MNYTTYSYTKEQLELLANHLHCEGRVDEALRRCMQEPFLWPDYAPHDRAYWILYHLQKIEKDGGKVIWPEMSEVT